MSKIEELPGPAQFLRALQEALEEGTSVLLDTPETLPISIDEWLIKSRSTNLSWHPLRMTDDPPLTCIRNNLTDGNSLDLPSPASLYRAPKFSGHIFYLEDLSQERLGEWIHFLEQFAHASRQQSVLERSAFLVHCKRSCAPDVTADLLWVRRHWDGVVDETDTLLLAHQLVRNRGFSPIQAKLRELLCVELARWDLGLCQRLAGAALETLLDPEPLLHDYAKSMPLWAHAPEDPPSDVRWKLGIEHTYCGRCCTHLAWQALYGDGKAEIKKAIWRAEVKTLFPFLEERRAEIITQRRNRLSVPHLRPNGNKEPIVISEFEDLEWGDISHQYRTNRRVNAEWAEFADHMHNIRNDLAHLRPVVDTRSLTPKILDFSLNS